MVMLDCLIGIDVIIGGGLGFVCVWFEDGFGSCDYIIVIVLIYGEVDWWDEVFDLNSGFFVLVEVMLFFGFGDVGFGGCVIFDGCVYYSFGVENVLIFVVCG